MGIETSFVMVTAMIALVVGAVMGAGMYITALNVEEEEEPREFAMEVSIDGLSYRINITSMPYDLNIKDAYWRMLTNCKITNAIDDPNGDTLRLENYLDIILFNSTKRAGAEASGWDQSTWGDHFYADHPEAQYNHTLYIVFYDDDGDGHLSAGDWFMVRSQKEYGFATAGYTFRLGVSSTGSPFGDIIFPEIVV